MSAVLAPNGDYNGFGNRKTGERTHDVTYKLVSTSHIDTGTAWSIAWAQMNAKYRFFQGCILRTVKVTGAQDRWGTVFDVVGHYELPEAEDDREPRHAIFHFSTRGGREKRVHSFATVGYPGESGTTPPDFKHGIGFNNGVFQGVDVVVPQMGFSIEYDMKEAEFSAAQIAYMHNITGCVNASPIWIFPKGSVLFLGITGQSHREKNDATGLWDLWYRVNFEFEAKPPIVNGNIQPFTGINKEGMQYFWVFHADRKEENSQVTVPTPVAGYVETVYPYADFSWFSTLVW